MQKYISRIRDESLEKFMTALNRITIEEGQEDVKALRQDGTVIETNIHYPTNNSPVYDCIKESERLLGHLKEEITGLSYEEYRAKGKRRYFKINVEREGGRTGKTVEKAIKTVYGEHKPGIEHSKKEVRIRHNGWGGGISEGA
jgi:IS5 family transposase